MGWQQDFICGSRQKVLLFILFFGKPLRPQVGGLGAQVIHFNSVIHWMFHCSEMEKYTGEQELKRNKNSYFYSCYTTDFLSTAHITAKVV